ncbi:MAG: TetR/AcrR family transcriptional regulator [Nocardioidaceae bacterium]|nr:TetR/AcrR family transcriptional regulator [Nocardioidaceae bacterium]
MSPRATPMSPDERRADLVAATMPLLRKHGRKVSTRQIAQAAGVAEGTIFRVFATKEELVEAAIAQAFAPGRMSADLDALDRDLPFRERMVALVALLQHRFQEIFGLMGKVGIVSPPDDAAKENRRRWEKRLQDDLVGYVGNDADLLAMPVDRFLHVLRMLTFSGSHPAISDNNVLSPQQIVDVVLDGVLLRDGKDS